MPYIKIAIRQTHSHKSQQYRIPIYVDGSFKLANKPVGGIGVFFPTGLHKPIAEPYHMWFQERLYPYNPPTSFRCELLAICRAMEVCIRAGAPVTIYSDSASALRVIKTQKNVENSGDILEVIQLMCDKRKEQFKFEFVPAHTYTGSTHSVGNAVADMLAKYGRNLK